MARWTQTAQDVARFTDTHDRLHKNLIARALPLSVRLSDGTTVEGRWVGESTENNANEIVAGTAQWRFRGSITLQLPNHENREIDILDIASMSVTIRNDDNRFTSVSL